MLSSNRSKNSSVCTRDINLEEPPNRWQLFVTWLLDSLTPAVPVVSTTGVGSLKSPASIWRGVVFVALVVGLMVMGPVVLATVTFDAEMTVTGRKLTYPADSQEYTFKIPYFYVKNKLKKVCQSASNGICLPSPDCQVDKNKTHVDSSGLGTFGGDGWGVFVTRLNAPGGGSATHDFFKLPTGVHCLNSTVEVCAKSWKGGGAWYEGSGVIYARCPTVDEAWTVSKSVADKTIPELGSTNVLNYSDVEKHDKFSEELDTVYPQDIYQDIHYTARVTKTDKLAPLLLGMFSADPNSSFGVGNGNQLWAISSTMLPDIQVSPLLEVTQGMQNLKSDMPLVEGRRTYVRAYIWSTLNIAGVSAKLFAERNGSSLGSILAEPINSQKKVGNEVFGGDRTKLDDSFLFKIPKEWRFGTVTFKVDVDIPSAIPEKDDLGNNSAQRTVTFQSPTMVNITTVPFHLHDNGNDDNPARLYLDTNVSFGFLLGNLYRYHPISMLRYSDCGVPIQKPTFHSFGKEWNMGKDRGRNKVLNRVSWVKFWHNCTFRESNLTNLLSPESSATNLLLDPVTKIVIDWLLKPSNLHWLGMIHPDINTNAGKAYNPGRALWVRMRPSSGGTLAHELAHNKGLKHVLCSGTEENTDSGYPYPTVGGTNCRLAKEDGNAGFFGFGVYDDFLGYHLPTVISNKANTVYPLMGYLKPRWISPYEYCKLLQSYGVACDALSKMRRGQRDGQDGRFTNPDEVTNSEKLQRLQNATRYFAVGGIIDTSTNTVDEYEVYQIDKPSPAALQDAIGQLAYRLTSNSSAEPPFTIVQLDNAAKELSSHGILLVPTDDGDEKLQPFLELVPLTEGVTSIQIRRATEVFAEKTASPHPPTVELLAPNQGGTLVAGSMVQWKASDLDGDELMFNVFYSPDDGQTWRLVEMNLTGDSFELSTLDNLPGSEHGRFRVMAYDGFNTAYDDSDESLIVPGSPPRAIIFQPSGMLYEVDQTVIINSIATDIDDGPITNAEQFTWQSDQDGNLGTGQELFTRNLSRGIHRLTLSVTDRDGNIGSSSIVVYIGVPLYRVSGKISDKLDNPLADATVQVGDITAMTDATGYWEIKLPEGEYTATTSKDGYIFLPQDFAVGNNENSTVVILPISNLRVKVTASSRTVRQDDNLTYTMTVINGGAEPATDIVLTDELPEGTSLVSFTALDGGECNADTLTCSLPDLTTGNSAKVELVIHNSQTKTLVNTATVTSNEYPTDMVKTRTRVIPHLSVSISDTPDPIAMAAVNGERILHYTITAELSPKAPTAATGIELISTLPKGVEIHSINSDAAMCEINNPQTVTCQLKDLSVTNPEDISSVNVALDVKLTDAGLLVLTNETKVSALEYPAHTYRERTQVFVPPEYKVKLAFVIDVTGSMEPEMNGVKRAILEVIGELEGQSVFPLSALVVFRDDVSVKAVTSDGTILTNAVERLKASQGGTCPEASAEALNKAIDHVEDGGSILFVTDASPYEDADIDALIERLLSHKIRVNVLMTGDCTNPDSWNKLPSAE